MILGLLIFFSREFQPKQFCHFQENAGGNTLCCNVNTTLATFSLTKCAVHALEQGVEIWSECCGLSVRKALLPVPMKNFDIMFWKL